MVPLSDCRGANYMEEPWSSLNACKTLCIKIFAEIAVWWWSDQHFVEMKLHRGVPMFGAPWRILKGRRTKWWVRYWPVWSLTWFRSVDDWLKHLWQYLQAKGFSRVWMRMWERRLLRELNPRLHTTHFKRPLDDDAMVDISLFFGHPSSFFLLEKKNTQKCHSLRTILMLTRASLKAFPHYIRGKGRRSSVTSSRTFSEPLGYGEEPLRCVGRLIRQEISVSKPVASVSGIPK